MVGNTILIIAIIGGILVLLFLVRYVAKRKRAGDKYDFDKLSTGIPVSDEKLHLDQLSGKMGIKNFKDVCKKAEEMVRIGKKDEAVNYLVQLTGIKQEKAENLVKLFESRYSK